MTLQPWERRTHIFFLLAFVSAVVVVWPLALPLAVGMTFAYVCERPFHALIKRFRVRRNYARWGLAFGFVALVISAFVAPLVLFVINGVQQLVQLAARWSEFPLLDRLNQGAGWVSSRLADYGIALSIAQIFDRLRDASFSLSNTLAANVGAILSGTPQAVFAGTIVLMTWIFFLVEGAGLRKAALPYLIPFDREREIFALTTGDVLRATILANVLVSVVQAITVTLLFLALGIPKASLWGGLAFFASFVPLLGTAPIVIGGAIYLFTDDHVVRGVVALVGALIVGGIDNILRPFFVKGSAELNFFWIFLAFIGGIAQFGVAGLVLGPLVFALVKGAYRALVQDEVKHRLDAPGLPSGEGDRPLSHPTPSPLTPVPAPAPDAVISHAPHATKEESQR